MPLLSNLTEKHLTRILSAFVKSESSWTVRLTSVILVISRTQGFHNQKGSQIMSNTKVSVRQAAKLTGMSRETINAATKDGIISYTLNERGHKVIDIAELERVYPITKTMEEIEQSETVKSDSKLTVNNLSELQIELVMLRERSDRLSRENEMLTSERVRERNQFESEIEHLRESLDRSQQQQKLLLTDQREREEGRGQIQYEQDRKLEDLSKEIKEINSKNKRIVKQYRIQKAKIEAMEQEKIDLLEQQQLKSASLWERLFG